MLNDLLVAFGVSASVIPALWQTPAAVPTCDKNGQRNINTAPKLSLVHSTLDLYKRQLLPGKNLDHFSEKLLRYISESLRWETVSARYPLLHPGSANRLSLKDFCAEVLVDAITRTFFGDRIYEVESELVQNLLDFNDDAWMLIFKYPQSSASKLSKARQKILRAFVAYMQSPEEMRSERAWMIERVMEDQKVVDMGDQDRAALLLMIYWA